MRLPKLSLVLGGAASGKSVFAEGLILGSGLAPVYVATAQSWDAEMAAKIAAHRAQRGPGWRLIEEPLEISKKLTAVNFSDAVLVDCATLWLTNVMLADRDTEAAGTELLAALADCPAPVVIVSNEVGQGIVPDNALARRLRTAQGRLNQRLAAQADLVVMVIAGLPMVVKGALA